MEYSEFKKAKKYSKYIEDYFVKKGFVIEKFYISSKYQFTFNIRSAQFGKFKFRFFRDKPILKSVRNTSRKETIYQNEKRKNTLDGELYQDNIEESFDIVEREII